MESCGFYLHIMSKTTTIFVCSECQHKTPRWQGKCPECGQWNTLEETRNVSKSSGSVVGSKPINLSTVDLAFSGRIKSHIGEFDEVLGGGLVPGSLVLLGGDPGIGKSTLALQLALNLGSDEVLYVSGEESAAQIKLRSSRLKAGEALQVLSETSLESVLSSVETYKPKVAVIDSIQTMYSEQTSALPAG